MNNPTILLLGAKTQADPLESVPAELNQLKQLLLDRHLNLNVEYEPYLTRTNLNNVLRRLADQVTILHFAGHSGAEQLQTNDETVYAQHIADILKTWDKKPTLLFLNGCNSAGQVDDFLNAGIPCVIATHHAINDQSASRFAYEFYANLLEHPDKATFKKAFDRASPAALISQQRQTRTLDIATLPQANGSWDWGFFTRTPDTQQDCTLLNLQSSTETDLGEKQTVAWKKRIFEAILKLTAHKNTLGETAYKNITRILNPSNPQNGDMLLVATERYLAGELDLQIYSQFCEDQIALLAETSPTTTDCSALVHRIMEGDTVLFIGSHIPCLYDATCPKEAELVQGLAQQAHYDDFTGDLASIAEFYQLKMEYGQTPLINNIKEFLPDNPKNFTFYNSLARSKPHLILISSTYDSLLEAAFLQTGKPFVTLSSIIHKSTSYNYDIGQVVVHFSDDTKRGDIYPQDELSKLNLQDNYSIIYKIRGTCDMQSSNLKNALPHALALSETNYISIAKNAENIIPNFLASLLLDRHILFVGFTPSHWEDRLLARILLDKRRDSEKECYTLNKPNNLLEDAYWQKRKVGYLNIDFHELDTHLQEITS